MWWAPSWGICAVSTLEKARAVECGVSYSPVDPLGLSPTSGDYPEPSVVFTPTELPGKLGSILWFTVLWYGGEVYGGDGPDRQREGSWMHVCCAYGSHAEALAGLAQLKLQPHVNGRGLDPEIAWARIT